MEAHAFLTEIAEMMMQVGLERHGVTRIKTGVDLACSNQCQSRTGCGQVAMAIRTKTQLGEVEGARARWEEGKGVSQDPCKVEQIWRSVGDVEQLGNQS